MKQEKNDLPNHALIRRKSGEILSQKGNRLLLIEAWMVLALSVPLWLTLQNVYDAIWVTVASFVELPEELYSMIPWGIRIPLLIYVILPLFFGVLQIARRMERGESPVLADVFLFFSDGALYRRAVWLSFGLIWRLGGTAGAIALTYALLIHWVGGSLLGGVLGGVLIVLELTVGVALLIGWFPTVAVALAKPGQLSSQIRREASCLRKEFPFAGFYFFFGFLPLLCLGVLTVGILLLADVLPRMCVGYFQYCNFMTDSLIRMEEKRYE